MGCCPRALSPPVPRSCLSPWHWLHRLGKGKGRLGSLSLPVRNSQWQEQPQSLKLGVQPPLGWDPTATCVCLCSTSHHLLRGNFLLLFSPTS